MKCRKGVTALTTIPASVRWKRIPIIVGSTRRKPKEAAVAKFKVGRL
jgi:hypothetical protein